MFIINWSNLIPNLSSWINTFLLAVILIIATSIVPSLHYLFNALYVVIAWIFFYSFFMIISALPQFIQIVISAALNFLISIISGIATLISPFVLLLPIPIIAFAHHYLYLLLARYYPDLDTAERGRATGYLPGIVSWWHGLFALLVIIIAMLFSDSVLSIFHLHNVNLADYSWGQQLLHAKVYGAKEYLLSGEVYGTMLYEAAPQLGSNIYAATRVEFWVQIALVILRQPIYRPFLRLIIWIIAAACIYQFEFNFREHLINIARSRDSDS